MTVTAEEWEARARAEAMRGAKPKDDYRQYDVRDAAGRLQCTVAGCPERARCLDVDNAARCAVFRLYRRRSHGEHISIGRE